MCALSALIETAQFLFIPGRSSTIGDVLTNSLGGALGFAIARHTFVLIYPRARMAMSLTIGWSAVWVTIQTASAFGFSPAFPRSRYYGEIAPSLGNFEQFRGRVFHASIADVVVPDTRFNDSPRVRELLIGGATVTTTVLLADSSRATAPIVRVADADEREILLLAQNGADLVFGVRTGAAALRLRPPLFALADGLVAVPPDGRGLAVNALTLSAGYSAREVWMSVQSRARHSRRIPITAALGWTMLLPFQWFIEGSRAELAISAIWTACLLLPIGYWLGGAIRFPGADMGPMIRTAAVAIASLFFLVGLIVVPHAFGVNPASPTDWLAALAGILSGVVLAPRALEEDQNAIGEAVAL
jgi:hypothetical protein